jgi:hypothetical protein
VVKGRSTVLFSGLQLCIVQSDNVSKQLEQASDCETYQIVMFGF